MILVRKNTSKVSKMSMQAVILRNQRKQQMQKASIDSTVVNIEQDQATSQQEQQQLKMLKAMRLASQEDHRFYSSNEKTVQFPQAAIKANAVALNPSTDHQSNPSRPFSLASSSHLSIRSDYGDGSLEDQEGQIMEFIYQHPSKNNAFGSIAMVQ